ALKPLEVQELRGEPIDPPLPEPQEEGADDHGLNAEHGPGDAKLASAARFHTPVRTEARGESSDADHHSEPQEQRGRRGLGSLDDVAHTLSTFDARRWGRRCLRRERNKSDGPAPRGDPPALQGVHDLDEATPPITRTRAEIPAPKMLNAQGEAVPRTSGGPVLATTASGPAALPRIVSAI